MKKLLIMKVAAVTVAITTFQAVADSALTIVPSGANINVSVPAGLLDGSSKLYLVWDTADRGYDLADWPSENRVEYDGAVSASAATYTMSLASVPANACARVITSPAVRLVDGYVHVGQNQYIDTGIGANSAYGFDIKFEVTGKKNNWGTVIAGGQDDFTIGLDKYTYRNVYLRHRGVEVHSTTPEKKCLNLGESGARAYRVFAGKEYLDGTELADSQRYNAIPTAGALGTNTPEKIILLCNDWGKGTSYGTLSYRQAYVDWYYVKLLGEDGRELANLVPALRGDSDEVVFWDKVSKKCVAKSGTSESPLTYSGNVTEAVTASECFVNTTTASWTGLGSTALLSDGGNWNTTPNAPGALTEVMIDNTGAKTAVVPDGTTTYSKMEIGKTATAEVFHGQGMLQVTAQHPFHVYSGTYTITNGTLYCTETGDSAFFVGQEGGTGHLVISGDGAVECEKICLGTDKNGNDNPRGYVSVSENGMLKARNEMWLGNTDNEYSEVRQSGGAVIGERTIYVGSYGEFKYILTAGRLVARSSSVTDGMVLGRRNTAHGSIEQSGGNIEVARNLLIGGDATDRRGSGTFEMSGGSLTVAQYMHIGAYGTGTFEQRGGEATFNNWTAIGRRSGGTGYCTVTGGTFTVTNTKDVGLNIGENGTGTLEVGGTGVVSVKASKGMTLGSAADGNGTLKMTGGTIITSTIKKGSGEAALVEFDGGTIQAVTADANILNGLTNIVLKAGGLTIDTQGKNLVINNCTFSVYPGGKITVTGGGTVTFSGVTLNLAEKMSESFVFAETDGVFSGTPTFSGNMGGKMVVSDDSKQIRIVRLGLIISFH